MTISIYGASKNAPSKLQIILNNQKPQNTTFLIWSLVTGFWFLSFKHFTLYPVIAFGSGR
jgi:hypothetical protein